MKIINIIIIFFMTTTSILSAEGPFSSGSKSIGGNFSYVNTTGDAYSDSDIIEFTPSISWCLLNGFFIGSTIRVRHLRVNYNRLGSSYGTSNSTQWQLGGSLERYFTKKPDGGGEFIPFLKTSILLGIDSDVTLFSLKNEFGMIKMISNTVGIEFNLAGTYDNYFRKNNSNSGYIIQSGIGFKTFIF